MNLGEIQSSTFVVIDQMALLEREAAEELRVVVTSVIGHHQVAVLKEGNTTWLESVEAIQVIQQREYILRTVIIDEAAQTIFAAEPLAQKLHGTSYKVEVVTEGEMESRLSQIAAKIDEWASKQIQEEIKLPKAAKHLPLITLLRMFSPEVSEVIPKLFSEMTRAYFLQQIMQQRITAERKFVKQLREIHEASQERQFQWLREDIKTDAIKADIRKEEVARDACALTLISIALSGQVSIRRSMVRGAPFGQIVA